MERWDCIVVGGGPAGLFAAIRACECGLQTLLLEANDELGRKLIISGGGRCNFTNNDPDPVHLAERYGKKGRALVGPFRAWSPQDVVSWFNARGLATKEEDLGRMFPENDEAGAILDVLIREARKLGVSLRTGTRVEGLVQTGNQERSIAGVKVQAATIETCSLILATGGTSHPETGSTGDGWRWLEKLGVAVRRPESHLVPVKVKESWPKENPGLAWPEARITPRLTKGTTNPVKGRVLFTHFGLSGPLVMAQSGKWRDFAKDGPLTLELDLFPALDVGSLDRALAQAISARPNAQLVNAFSSLMPSRLFKSLAPLVAIDSATPGNALPRESRKAFADLLKKLSLSFDGLMDSSWAVTVNGGIDPGLVDFRTMRLKDWANLFVVGDLLDFDRPSGGFSLQVCWSTGRLAGEGAAAMHAD